MNPTHIEWSEYSWNPVTGCTPVSRGCDRCYARTMAETRLRGRCGYPADEPFRVTLHPKRLDQPLTMRKPRLIFVSSMGDLFHKDVPDGFINRVICTIAWARWHTFLILTKRPQRMRDFFLRHQIEYPDYVKEFLSIPNLWLGTSVEDQATADQRIPLLLATPAAVRFVSYEPALGPVDFTAIKNENVLNPECWGDCACDSLYGYDSGCSRNGGNGLLTRKIDWLIMGGESGPGARAMYPAWAGTTRDQCQAAGVPFFFKQWGSWSGPVDLMDRRRQYGYNPRAKKGGRILDGRTHDDYPGAAHD